MHLLIRTFGVRYRCSDAEMWNTSRYAGPRRHYVHITLHKRVAYVYFKNTIFHQQVVQKHAYIYIYIYIYMCVYIFYIYIYIYIYIAIFTWCRTHRQRTDVAYWCISHLFLWYISLQMLHVCMYAYACMHVCIRMYACMHTHVCMFLHVCTHTYSAYIHTCIHMEHDMLHNKYEYVV